LVLGFWPSVFERITTSPKTKSQRPKTKVPIFTAAVTIPEAHFNLRYSLWEKSLLR